MRKMLGDVDAFSCCQDETLWLVWKTFGIEVHLDLAALDEKCFIFKFVKMDAALFSFMENEFLAAIQGGVGNPEFFSPSFGMFLWFFWSGHGNKIFLDYIRVAN